MAFFIIKVLVTALVVAIVTEVSKRSGFLASALIALPMISILSFIWIYIESRDVSRITKMSWDIFWLVLPSLLFFILLPALLKRGLPFVWSLLISCAALSVVYAIYAWALKKLGVA